MTQGYLYARPLDHAEAELELMRTVSAQREQARKPPAGSSSSQPPEHPDA
jgi:hypothetical protein